LKHFCFGVSQPRRIVTVRYSATLKYSYLLTAYTAACFDIALFALVYRLYSTRIRKAYNMNKNENLYSGTEFWWFLITWYSVSALYTCI